MVSCNGPGPGNQVAADVCRYTRKGVTLLVHGESGLQACSAGAPLGLRRLANHQRSNAWNMLWVEHEVGLPS